MRGKMNPEDVVAIRRLRCEVNGRRQEVTVRLGRPMPENEHFLCNYEISFPEDTESYRIAGLDGIQALQLAMFMVGSTLQSWPGAEQWHWNDEPHTGFPTRLDQPIVG